MSNLSEKLKALGVNLGTDETPIIKSRQNYNLENVLSGNRVHNYFGEVFSVDSTYPITHQHGNNEILFNTPLDRMSFWVGDDLLSNFEPNSFAFLDIETTGLSGGTGTYAFLIGVGRFEVDDFHLAQYFMVDPIEEAAQLAALEEFLAPCKALVTYNGKSFDIPILTTRYIQHGWRTPFEDQVHVDLLHLSRRIWKERLPSRTLSNLEVQILGSSRTEEDVPGWLIPQLYFDYLRSGDARPLKRVFYHNAMDILSLVALFKRTSKILTNPLSELQEHVVDLLSLARLFEDLGDLETATSLYVHGLEHSDTKSELVPKEILVRSILRLALIYKRQGDDETAAKLWQEAAHYKSLEAYEELAKLHEHRLKNIGQAIKWTEEAISDLSKSQFNSYDGKYRKSRFIHRSKRLKQKLKRIQDQD